MPAPLILPESLKRLRCLSRCGGFFAGRCSLCGEPLSSGQRNSNRLCPECSPLLAPRLAGFCPFCGEMTDKEQAIRPCTLCAQRAAGWHTVLPWSRLCFYAPYGGVLRACILAYKMRGRLGLGALLQGLTLAGWQQNSGRMRLPDIIVPVPLHAKRLRQRGFNQSLELARPLARRLKRPLAPTALRRTRATTPQFQLEFAERPGNIRGAFAPDPAQVANASVLLVDDIMTTGATLEECCQVLRQAGARDVSVLVLARTGKQ